MGNTFSTDIENKPIDQTTDNIEINDLKEKSLIQENDNNDFTKNIKKSSNLDEMECIDDYCNNFFINGHKSMEKLENEDKDEDVNEKIDIINMELQVNDDNNKLNNSNTNLHVTKNSNTTIENINQESNNFSTSTNHNNINNNDSNNSLTTFNNSRYSGVATVNNSINYHKSSYVEEIFRNHHYDTNNNNIHDDINNIPSSGFVSHEDLLDNFDNGTVSDTQSKNLTSSSESSINKKFDELLKSENDLNKCKDNQLLLSQVNESNDVCLDINSYDSDSSGKDYISSNYDSKNEDNNNDYENMGNYFFNNKDIMLDSNIIDYGYNPIHYDMWNAKERSDMLYDNSSNNNSDCYYNGDSSYKSSFSDTFSTKNKYKGYQEFKHEANNSSYFLNKNENVKTDSQIMLFPEIAKQLNKKTIKIYNSKPFSINSYDSLDDFSSVTNHSSLSKQHSFSQSINEKFEDEISSTLKCSNINNNDSTIFHDINTVSLLQNTRSNSVVVNNENDFNKNKLFSNLVRESQYNLRNIKNLKLKNNRSKELNLNKPIIRYNSCSTLLIDNTITTADMDDTLKCVTLAILYRIKANHKKNVKLVTNNIFSEKLYPLTRHPRFSPNPPTEQEIFNFLSCLFHAAELNSDCAIITLIYVERMLAYTNITIHSCNWTRILLGGVLLASKVWDDHAIWNADFCQIFPNAAVEDMNKLERWYMNAINYNVSIRSSLFVKYYFELRELMAKKGKHLKLKPLNSNEAKILEEKMNHSNGQLDDRFLSVLHYTNTNDKGIRRTVSDSNFKTTITQASLL